MSKKSRKKSRPVETTAPVAPVQAASAAPTEETPSRASTITGIVFALILAVTLGLRIVVDGIVYPYWNYPFVLILGGLFVVWALLALLRVTPVRMPRETALLAGFVLWGAIGLTYTVEYDATFRAVLIWAACACVFAMCTSALNTRTAVAIVLGGFGIAAFAEAIFSLIHVRYMLPLVRLQVQADPALYELYFGVRAATDDLTHRLQSNRAFGTFLFPNALGAYMVLAIPFAAAGAVASIQRLRGYLQDNAFQRWAMESSQGAGGKQFAIAIGLSILIAVTLFSSAFVLIGVIAESDVLGRTWFNNPLIYWFCVAVVPLVSGGFTLYAMRVYGFTGFAALFRAGAYPIATVVLTVTLFAAFTRGAMIALALAALVIAWLLVKPPKWTLRPAQAAAAGLILCLAMGAGALTIGALSAAAQEEPAPVARPLDIAGASPTMGEALSGATLGLRFGYWAVGLRMWRDNIFTGVGLGNFGAAYPNYQFIGADDVKTAHNDFLQILAETGPIGFLLFTGFWAVFFIRGARAIPAMDDRYRRMMAAGLYTGLLAFVLHSAVDFNFVNPSLTMPAFALAGTFYALVRPLPVAPDRTSRSTVQLALLIPVLALIAVLAGAATRAYATDTQVRRLGHANQFNSRPLQAANYILSDAVPERVNSETDFSLPVPMIMELIPDRPILESMGVIVAPTNNPQNPWRRVSANEPLDESMFVIIRNLDTAHRAARQAGVKRAELLAAVDSAYPHRTDVANHLYQWYYLLLNTTQNPAERAEFIEACVKWARECVARGPRRSWHHSFLGNALWERAKLQEGGARIRTLEEAIDHYRRAAELYPLQTSAAHEYAHAMRAFGQILVTMGHEERGRNHIAQAEVEHRRAEEFQAQIDAWRHRRHSDAVTTETDS